MATDLLEEVKSGLAKRKSDWRKIAAAVGMSYSLVSRLGLGNYTANPTYKRLKRLRQYLTRSAG